jgi:hypothetical protein
VTQAWRAIRHCWTRRRRKRLQGRRLMRMKVDSMARKEWAAVAVADDRQLPEELTRKHPAPMRP